MREQLITQNAYIIDTSIRQRTGLLLPHHHVPELPEDEIGDLYRIPLRVRELAAHAANLFGRDWPLEFTALPNGTVVRVNTLWLDWHYGVPMRMAELRVDDMEARRAYHHARGRTYTHTIPPRVLIEMEYEKFMHPRIWHANTATMEVRDIEQYWVGNDRLPALIPQDSSEED